MQNNEKRNQAFKRPVPFFHNMDYITGIQDGMQMIYPYGIHIQNIFLTNIGNLGKMQISENLVKENACMQDDDILRAIQDEKPVEEYENTVARSALRIAAAVGVICAMVMTVVECLVAKKIDFGKPFLIALIAGLTDVIEWHRRKEKRSMEIFGILKLIFAALCLVLYIVSILGVL